MSLFWSKFPISETKKYNNKMKTCKYKHKIISPFSSRHLGWIPLLMWAKTTLYFTPFTISILFSRHLPWMSFFVSCIFTLRFSSVFLVSSWSKLLDIFPHPHILTPMASLARFPKHPHKPPHKRFVWFVLFSPTN